MKKTLKKLALLTAILILTVGCKKDDDSAKEDENKFTIQGTDYETLNGYLLLDDGPSYTNSFGLVFLEGTMREDNINGSSISTDTNHGIVVFVEFGNTNVNSEQAITNMIIDNSTYPVDDETTAITDIISYTDTYMNGGIQYGNPDDATATLYVVNATGSGSLTINTFTVDLSARTGTVDCSYTFLDDNGANVSGQFDGTFEIINEF